MENAEPEKARPGTPGRSYFQRRDALGRLGSATGALTPRQRLFVLALVRNGGQPAAAASEAGYKHPATSAAQLLDLPHVAAAVRDARCRAIENTACLAVGVLRDVLADTSAPASARIQAARLTLALAGHVEPVRAPADQPPAGGVPLESMTVDALERFVAGGLDAVRRLRPVIDAQAERVTP